MRKILFALLLIGLVVATVGCGKGGTGTPVDDPDSVDEGEDSGDEGLDDFGEDLDALDDLDDLDEPDIDPDELDLS